MKDFQYYAPTRVIFGRNAEEKAGEMIAAQGSKKVLIHYGGESAKRSGLLARVQASLDEKRIPWVELGGVVPNPRIEKAREGIELCRGEEVDFILAVGGGSVIDSAKAIAYGVPYKGDVWDFYIPTAVPQTALPVGAVLTLSAAGSEMSDSSVLTNEALGIKRGCNNNLCRCRFALLNPELTYTLPAYQTACGVTDIMMHTMERFFSQEEDLALTDRLGEGLIKTVMDSGCVALNDPQNYNARAQIMWAGSLSHNGLTGCGSTGDWACHKLEHAIGGKFDVAHGAGLAAVWGSWARYVCQANLSRFVQFAVNVMGCTQDFYHPERTALAGIEAMENYYRRIGMPTNLRELGLAVTDEQIDAMAAECSLEGTRKIGAVLALDQEDIKAIYRMARS